VFFLLEDAGIEELEQRQNVCKGHAVLFEAGQIVFEFLLLNLGQGFHIGFGN